jgi:hypothetical protein
MGGYVKGFGICGGNIVLILIMQVILSKQMLNN